MATNYVINFTDPAKPSFSVQAYKTNGPVSPTNAALDPDAVSANTTLLLYGKGSPNYGERIQEDLIHVMEHFSGPTAPVYPTRGQIWHDTSAGMLKMYSGSVWISLDAVFSSGTAPSSPSLGQLWYDTNIADDLGQFTVSQLKVWNGSSWVSASANYLLKTGDTMTGALAMGTNKITGLGDATLATDALNMQTGDARYVNISGDTMTGALTLNADPTLALHAATKQYVDVTSGSVGTHISDMTVHLTSAQNTLLDGLNLPTLTAAEINYLIGATSPIQTQINGKVAIAGDTMTGFLTLHANPVNPFHASTKQYVDTTVAGATGDGVLDTAGYNSDTQTLTLTTSAPASGTFIVPMIHSHTYYAYKGIESSPGLWAYYDNHTITAVNITLDTFTVAGDYQNMFPAGYQFAVSGSTGNDGTWTVDTAGSTFDGVTNTTIIPVLEDITNSTADGTIYFISEPALDLNEAFSGLDIIKAPVTSAILLETTTLNIERAIISAVTGASGSYNISGDHTATFVSPFVFSVVRSGVSEITDVTTVADVAGSLAGTHFTLNTPTAAYYVWYKVNGVGTDPKPVGKIPVGYVDVATNATADAVATATQILIDNHWALYASVATNIVTITNVSPGIATDAAAGTSGFTVTVTTQGTDGHNGTYTTASSSYNGGTNQTTIVITGTVPVATIGTGHIQWPQQPTARAHAATKEYSDSVVRVLENSQSVDYTLVLSDANKLITLTGATPRTFTIPLNSSVAFPLGTTVAFTQDGTGQLTIAGAGGVTVRTEVGYNLNAQYAMASAVKVATDTWRLAGSLKV